MRLTLPQLKNTTPSKLRLHGNNWEPGLSQIVGRPIPGDFNPDEISWVRPCIGITDWEGACEAIALRHYVITVAPEISIGSDIVIGLEPYDRSFMSALGKVSDTIDEIVNNTGKSVVVHCAMGMERSVLAVVWFMASKWRMQLHQALKHVQTKRPIALNRLDWISL